MVYKTQQEREAYLEAKEKEATQIARDNLARSSWLLIDHTNSFIKGLKTLIDERIFVRDSLAMKTTSDDKAQLQLITVEIITLKKALNYARTGKYEYSASSSNNTTYSSAPVKP